MQEAVGSGSVFSVRKFLAVLLMLVVIGSGAAQAHQPVVLLDTDTSAAKGPLLVDGTVSFAIRASFTKTGQNPDELHERNSY